MSRIQLLLVILVLIFNDYCLFAQNKITPKELDNAQKAYYYLNSVQNYDRNWRRLKNEGTPWENFGVRAPADYIYAMASTEVFFQKNPSLRVDFSTHRVYPMVECTTLLALIRKMQEKSETSPFRGNFRWYWRQNEVVDRNAVEFVTQRLIFCLKYKEFLPPSWIEPIRQILIDAAPEILRRTVKTEYTNIAALNCSNLILLGELLENEEYFEEGKRRLYRFIFYTYMYGIHEFTSQTYFTTTLEAFEQLYDMSNNEDIRTISFDLLSYWSYVIALHFQPKEGRLVGATSRTYNYLGGDPYLGFHLGTWGWCDLPKNSSNITILTALNTNFRPPEEVIQATNDNCSKTICERWGTEENQWKKTFRTRDYAVGTASSAYNSLQDQLWTVDWTANENEDTKKNIRTYFIPDGRGDPWGIAREETSGGHQKALHLNPEWHAIQNNSQTQCEIIYSSELVQKFLKERPGGKIVSTWVLKRPDRYNVWRNEKNMPTLALYYGKYVLRLTIDEIENRNGNLNIVDSKDGNAIAWCLEHDMLDAENNGAKVKFSSIILDLDNETENTKKIKHFSALPTDDLYENIKKSVLGPQLENNIRDILTIQKSGLSPRLFGREFLSSKIPILGKFAQATQLWCDTLCTKSDIHDFRTINIVPGQKFTHPATAGLFFEPFSYTAESQEGSVAIQAPTFYRFHIANSGKYRLSAHVLAPDPRRDSLQVTFWTPTFPQGVHFSCWALGNSSEWRTVPFLPTENVQLIENRTLILPKGDVFLRFTPREQDVQIQKLIFERIK